MTIRITLEDVCRRMGRSPDALPPAAREAYQAINTEYRPATSSEVDGHILRLLKRLHGQSLGRSESENRNAFEAGWNENHQLCLEKGLSWESLRPGYVKAFGLMRYDGRFVAPENPFLPDDLLSLYATIAFLDRLDGVSTTYEFGCGTGRFLFRLARLFPEMKLVGADWTEASFDILRMMADAGHRIEGFVYDMLKPAQGVRLAPDSAVVTIGALEQLGTRFGAFLDFLLSNRPRVVLHLEPILEFYSPDNLFDYLAILYHQKRGYLEGYWPALKALESAGRIRLLAGQRLSSGDPHHESSSYIVWQPVS